MGEGEGSDDLRARHGALERKLDAIFDAIDDAVVVTDPEGRVVEWNRGAARIFGRSREEVAGKPFVSMFPEVPSMAKNRRRMTPELSLDKPWSGRIVHRIPDGSDVELDVVTRALKLPEGGIEGRVAVYRPTQIRVKLDNQLMRADRLVSLGTLAGGLSHEFNNLLGVVLSHTSFLAARLSDEAELASSVRAMANAAQRGAELTTQLQAFSSRGTSGRRVADLVAAVRSVVRLVGPAQRSGLTVEVSFDESPVRVAADSAGLSQALLSLFLNAREAGGGEAVVRVNASVGTERIRIHVDDDGPGVPEGIRGRIFDPFFSTRGPDGTGLGLAVVHALVEGWGGTIVVESAPSGGARFTLDLPRADAGEEPSVRERRVSAALQRVLVVDDEPAVRAGTGRLVRLLGADALLAASGEEAVELLRTTEVDLLVVDVVMPGMSGIEVYNAVRQTRPTLPILLVSGYSGERVVERIDGDPHARFLAKPFDLLGLAGEVQTLFAD